MAYYKFYLNASTIADQIRSGEYKQNQQAKQADTESQNALIRRPQKQAPQEEYKPSSPEELAAHYMNLVSYDDIGSDFGEGTSGIGGSYTSTVDSFTSPTNLYGGYTELKDLVDATEGGGSYDTLLGFSNNDIFAGKKVSEMTIGELKAFSNGAYGEFSKNKLGYKATPMGRYQIVGATLADTANKLGLDDSTVFSPETQDHMFAYLADTAIKANGIEGLRSTWEGFKKVPDSVLKSAADNFQSESTLMPKKNKLVTRSGK